MRNSPSANALIPLSPQLQVRRDSILKHTGSVKTEKRVSIQTTTPNMCNVGNAKSSSNVEYVSEKLTNNSNTAVNSRNNRPPSGPRPASLVITKNDNKLPHLKLVRSSSVDYDDVESQIQARNVNRVNLIDQLQEDESAPLVFTVMHK